MSTKTVMDTTGSRGRRRKRFWPEALKREIVAATFAPGSSVSIVARQYDVNANQVFSWRKRYRDEPRAIAAAVSPGLIPVTITAEQDGAAAAVPMPVSDKIAIEVGGKYRITVSGDFEGKTLRRVLDALERR